MPLKSASQQTHLITLREEYRRAFCVFETETSRLLYVSDCELSNTVAVMEARHRQEQALQSYREARNALAVEMMRRQRQRCGFTDKDAGQLRVSSLARVSAF